MVILDISKLSDFLTRGAIYALGNDRFCVGWESSHLAPEAVTFRFLYPEFFFDAADESDWLPRNQAIVDRATLEQALRDYLAQSEDSPPSAWQTTREAFLAQFTALKDLIARGVISKGVPYGQLQATIAVDPTWIARRLQTALREGKSASLYGIWNGTDGLIGCSPERLCEYDGETRILTAEAVAGTTPLKGYEPGALFNDSKAVQEHSLVIDDLVDRLSDLGKVEIGSTREYQVPGLVHLKAPLRVAVGEKEISLNEVVRRLHPTAALGVYPRNEAGRAWLRDADRCLPRWRFGAPFGISQASNQQSGTEVSFSCLVSIRNVQWRGQDVRINAGCGVVESSQLEGEWQECLAKIQSIRNLLDL